MEVDHFNPTLSKASRNNYVNLFLSTRHCNNAKSETWPQRSARKKGIRLLNPCEEIDYGEHIFEHPVTHRLIGISPAGEFHIITCDLNARHLVDERRERARIFELLQSRDITLKTSPVLFPSMESQLLREQFEKMIPPIPYLPVTHAKYKEELEILQALYSEH
jgi:hypothetical protein